MHLHGYGCGGASAVHYGLACLELEAADSGIRSLVSVQGSLAMFAIWNFGSEEQKQQWLPGMAAGELLGCFGLTEPDAGSDPAAMKTRARRDGSDWVLNGRKMWITNGSVADVAVVWAPPTTASAASSSPPTRPASPRHDHPPQAVAAGLDHQRAGARRRPAARRRDAARRRRASAGRCPACPRRATASSGARWARRGRPGSPRSITPRSATQFGRPIAGFQLTQAKLVDMAVELHKGSCSPCTSAASRTACGLRPEQVSFGKLNNAREAIEICRTARTILGGNGISLEYPVIRHMVNLESVLTYEGTPEMHQLVLGQAFTGSDAFR